MAYYAHALPHSYYYLEMRFLYVALWKQRNETPDYYVHVLLHNAAKTDVCMLMLHGFHN
jgi:hypothetical protein